MSSIAFPRGLTGPRDAPFDFSFSGLKTSVARWVEARQRAGETVPVADVAASFQEAVVDGRSWKEQGLSPIASAVCGPVAWSRDRPPSKYAAQEVLDRYGIRSAGWARCGDAFGWGEGPAGPA